MTTGSSLCEPLVLAFMHSPAEVAEAYRRLNGNAVERRGGLTSQQLTVLKYIERHIADHGCSPTLEAIARAVGLASKSNVHRYLQALEDRGFIRRTPSRRQSIELIARAA